jgi:hypothetical protein
MNTTKTCSECCQTLPLSSFYGQRLGAGKIKYHNLCKDCQKAYMRKKYAEDEKYKEKRKIRYKNRTEDQKRQSLERSALFYQSISGRAKTLLSSAKRRSSNFEESFDIDFDHIFEKLNKGTCEVTGIPFDFSKPSTSSKNPYAPSIDRIDPKIGYTKANTRIVIWQYNLMKGELYDEEILNLCRLIVERNDNVLDIRSGDLP